MGLLSTASSYYVWAPKFSLGSGSITARISLIVVASSPASYSYVYSTSITTAPSAVLADGQTTEWIGSLRFLENTPKSYTANNMIDVIDSTGANAWRVSTTGWVSSATLNSPQFMISIEKLI